jgi:hypothetical protein
VDMAFDILKKARSPPARLPDPRPHPSPVRHRRRSRKPRLFTH